MKEEQELYELQGGIKPYTTSQSGLLFEEDKGKADTSKTRISGVLSRNISAKRELSLFDSLTAEQKRDWIKDTDKTEAQYLQSPEYVDRNGKPVSLSNMEIKAILVLSEELSKHLEDEDIQKISGANVTKGSIIRKIHFLELSKRLFKSTRPRDIEKTGEIIRSLAQRRQRWELKNDEKGTYYLTAPVILLKEAIEYKPSQQKSGRGRKSQNEEKEKSIVYFANIEFSRLFFKDIQKDFCYIAPKLLDEWGTKKGTNTELYAELTIELMSKYTPHYKLAKVAIKNLSKEKKKLSEEEYQKKLEKALKEALTYREKIEGIKNRLRTDYGRKKGKFEEHLKLAIENLMGVGLITGAKMGTGINKDCIDFFFNMNYSKEPEE